MIVVVIGAVVVSVDRVVVLFKALVVVVLVGTLVVVVLRHCGLLKW